jgi:hypothetical protein
MNISAFRRVLAAVAVVVPVTVGLPAVSASASAPAARSVTCRKLVGSPVADTASLSRCTSSATGGSGAISNFLPTGGHVVWANKTTTDYSTTSTGETDTDSKPCPATTNEFELSGHVTASTNAALPVGSVVKMEVCVSSKKITKEPATLIKF